MNKMPDLIGLKLDNGKVILEQSGFQMGEIYYTLAPNSLNNGEIRIVKQKKCGDYQIDLVVVSVESLLGR